MIIILFGALYFVFGFFLVAFMLKFDFLCKDSEPIIIISYIAFWPLLISLYLLAIVFYYPAILFKKIAGIK